jgi:hypothetical protein
MNSPHQAYAELLETRMLMAGNVTAMVVNGNLIVSGDGDRNRIVVTSKGLGAGEVLVGPADDATTVNEQFNAVLTGVTGSIVIRTRGGADTINLLDLAVDKALRVDGGKSDDVVLLNRVRVDGALDVRGRAGDDRVTVLDSTLDGRAYVAGDGGADRIVVDAAVFNGEARIRGGDGDDQFAVDSSTFHAGKDVQGDDGDDETLKPIDLDYSFGTRRRGWTPGFADYPKGEDEAFELHAGLRPAPAELGWRGDGFRLTGNNHSDDLFMFLKRQLGPAEGLKPDTDYQVRFTITFGSDAASGGGGIGGSPGDSVYLRAGASTVEPKRVLADDGRWRMNVDKGDQATGGKDISVVGPIANGVPADEVENPPKYKQVERTHVHTAAVRTDAQGRLWVIVGTDSGFEGVTRVYYKSIAVRLLPA